MTENQIFSMSTELFDTSSNSNNPLKYDSLYSLGGLATSVGSATALFATFTNSNSGGDIGISTPFTSTTSSNISGGGNTSGSNVMLTNAITIPRSNNPNQSHNPYQDEAQHHPASSPFLSHLVFYQQHQNPQQQQQQPNISNIMSSSANMQQQQHQQQQQQHHQQNHQHQNGLLSNSLSDYSDYALDSLDTSLSPTLLQDVSLSAANNTQSLSSVQNSTTNITSSFFNQDASSPLSNNGVSIGSNGQSTSGSSVSANCNSFNISSPTGIRGVVTFLDTNTNTDESSSASHDPNISSMWNDVNAVTKHEEPFPLEDTYIFPLDKSDVNPTGFEDFERNITNLEDITNLDEFLPSGSQDEGAHSFHLLSPSFHVAAQGSTPSPGMGPPMELLQQDIQHFSELHSMQNSSATDNDNTPSGSNRIALQIEQNHHSSSSPYEIYHSTPNKHQLQQQQHSNNFSPGSVASHSPLQINSITPPPHANRSQYQQSQMKSTNMQQQMKKGFSISPDRNNLSSLLGQSVPVTHGLLTTSNPLSPSSGSSGFGSSNSATISSGSSNAPVISVNSARKQFYQTNEGNAVSRLSSSAPTHLGPADIWIRREPRQHLLSTSSLAEAESFSSLSTASVLSPDGHDYSQDDDDDGSTDYNSDHYDDLSSENGSDNDDDSSTLHGRGSNCASGAHMASSKGKERFFWQYNVQAKGPKGKRLVFQSKLEDPHVLNEVTDPVFSPNCSVRGIKVYKHSGKARKGDGNDLTPNPRKLHNIGKELDRLSRTINDMTPVSELPFNVRPKSRKEKNKLASRACRLKKKAQHEANKIKLFGLEIEHKRLLNAISDIKQNVVLKYRKQNIGENPDDVDQEIERIYKHAIGGLAIAGSSTDFVNRVLANVRNGQTSGGLEELRNT